MDNLKWAIEFCIQLAKVENIELNDLIEKIKSAWEIDELMQFVWED